MLAAVSEPTRFRIVELLSARACAVGEVAEAVGALQPQTTKHVQTLVGAGVVRVHKLGRRRVARLDRGAMAGLAAFFNELAVAGPDDAELERYEAAIVREESRAVGDDGSRVLTLTETLSAPLERVWAAWTDPAQAARWWAPRHFDVDLFEISDTPDAPIRLVLREGDGARFESVGRLVAADPLRRLEFDLAPVDDAGQALFEARHTVDLKASGTTTHLTLTIAVSGVRTEAASAVAGLEPGWSQLLDALREVVEDQTR
jgi:uncharacterized protein YndB with AHSA1/START domain